MIGRIILKNQYFFDVFLMTDYFAILLKSNTLRVIFINTIKTILYEWKEYLDNMVYAKKLSLHAIGLSFVVLALSIGTAQSIKKGKSIKE